MKLIVEQCQRYAKMRAHTATHLLHTQLAKIFKTTKQAGSLVDEDYLRFDFNADRLLTQEELARIEKRINQLIYISAEVVVEEMSMTDATKLGAKAFFEDKYGDTVRVVRIINKQLPKDFFQDDTEEYFSSLGEHVSIELCGGTHLTNTKDIWCFTITWQEAVASGIKRITAVTGPKVSVRINEVQWILDMTVEKLWIKTHTQLVDKLEKTLKEYDEMKSTLESLESKMIVDALQTKDTKSDKHFQKIIKISSDLNFKNVLAATKWLFDDMNVIIFNDEGNFLLLAKKWTSAKVLAQELWLKGWGNDTMVQGRDENILSLSK